MPADPYTLGIGVEIDRRATRDALGRFARDVEADAEPVGTALEEAFGYEDLLERQDLSWFDRLVDKVRSVKAPAAEAFNSLRSFVDFFREGSDFLKPAEELENATQRMAVTMGGGKREAAGLRDEIFGLVEATRFSLAEVTQLDQGLSATGQTLGSFSEKTRTAFINLNQTFGVAGEEIARTDSTMRGFGGSIEGLLGDATTFTKSFKIPGLFQELPHLVDGARDAVLRFGDRIVGSGASIVRATTNMAGVFVKAFGTTISDAIGRAQESISKFAGAARQDTKVFLGLETEFSGLTMALMQTGMGVKSAMGLVQEGAKGSLDAVANLAAIRDRMPEGLLKDRFTEQLRDELPADILDLVLNVGKLKSALDAKAEADAFAQSIGGQNVEAFNSLGSSVLDTTVELRRMFNNVLELTRAVIGNIAVTMGLPEILKDVKNRFASWAGTIREFTKSGEFTETIERWKPTLVKIGSTLLTVGTAVTSVGGAILGLGGVLMGTSRGLLAFDKLIGRLGSAVPGLGRVFEAMGGGPIRFFSTVVGKLVGKAGPIGLAIAAFQGLKSYVMEAGAVLGDPNATGLEKFESIIRGVGKGAASFIDTILLGIPSMIVDRFFPDLEMNFESGVSGLVDKISGFFGGGGAGGLVDSIGNAIGGALRGLSGFMVRNLPDMTSFAAGFGKALGGAMAGMQKFMVEILAGIGGTIVGLFTNMFSDGVTAGTDQIRTRGPTIGDSLLTIMRTVGETLLSFFGGVAEGILGTFGVNLGMLGTTFAITWEQIGFHAGEIFRDLGEGFMTWFSDPLSLGLLNIRSFFEEVFTHMFAVGATIFERIRGTATVAFSGMKMLAAGMAETVAIAFSGMATQAIDSLGAMVAALPDFVPGVEGMKAALSDAKTAVSSLGTGFSQMSVQAAQEANLAQVQSQARLAAIQGEKNASLSAIDAQRTAELEFFSQKQQARDAEEQQREEAHQNKIDQLTGELNAAQVAFDAEQQHATDARRFREASRSQVEQALQTLGADAVKTRATDDSAREAAGSLRDFMSEQVKEISDAVAKGELTSTQAADRLKEMAAKGLAGSREQLKTKTPTEASQAAGGAAATPTPVQGLTNEGMAQLLKNLGKDVSAAKQRVDVRLSGDGAVSKALAAQANVRRQSINGGGS